MTNVEALYPITHQGNQPQLVTSNIENVKRTYLVGGWEKTTLTRQSLQG